MLAGLLSSLAPPSQALVQAEQVVVVSRGTDPIYKKPELG